MDARRDPAHDGGHISRTEADFEDPVFGQYFSRLEQEADDVRLRYRLSGLNRQRSVLKSEFRERIGNEALAGDFAHRVQHF